jgi:signal peptidase II
MSSTPDAVPASDEPAAPAISPARRRRLLTLVAVLAVAVLAVDQATKVWAVSTLTEGERTDVVGDLLGLTLLYNPGAALSIATGMTWVLTVVAVVVVVVTVRASRRIGSRTWAVALGLLLGGAAGNLVDRFARDPGFARGHVVDFIAYGNLFVGNVADIAIVGAAGLIVLLALLGIGLDGSREHAARTPHHRAEPQHRAHPHAHPQHRADRAEPQAEQHAVPPADTAADTSAADPSATPQGATPDRLRG